MHIREYLILELEHEGEALRIYFPGYEIDTLESVTGLKTEMADN